MRRLAVDPYSRRGATSRRRHSISSSALALMLLSLALLVLSRTENGGLKAVRWQLAEWLAPVMAMVSAPLAPVRWAVGELALRRDLREENARLLRENQLLAGWEARARELERRLASLGVLARVVEESAIPFITARVVAESSGPLVRAVIVEAGRESSLKPGHPVIGAEGLVGRVVETGRRAARVLLITDRASRIPVLIGSGEVRGLLVGDTGAQPHLRLLPAGAELKAGDEVATSGIGGMFPRGLGIGRVVGDAVTGYRVAPHVALDRLDYVSILLADLPALDIADEAASPAGDVRSRRAQARPVGSGP